MRFPFDNCVLCISQLLVLHSTIVKRIKYNCQTNPGYRSNADLTQRKKIPLAYRSKIL